MLRVSNLKLGIDEDISLLKKLILKKLKIKENELIKYFIYKESIDARKRGRIDFVYTVDVEVKNENKILKNSIKDVVEIKQRNYIGVEMYDSVLLRALQKRERMEADGEKLDNLKFMCVDARILPDIFEKGEVQRIYLNFSDPWPKARHAKRRLTSREFLARYSQILTTGETVEFKTDNKDLFEFSLDEVTEAEGWTLLAHTFDLHHQEDMMVGNVMTEYEEKFSSMGNPICKLIARCEE